jgi:glycosyltransferase involved in cell wall biosynthesis
MVGVTSVTLTYNEEENIGDCLDSVDWCDERIVVDEFSSDATVDVARECGATVYQTKTPEDADSYEVLRKFGIERAETDWILRIDADERSHPSLNTRLQSLIESEAADVVMVPRQTFVGTVWIDHGRRWWPDRSPVAFRKDAMDVSEEIHRSLRIRPEADIVELPATADSALRHYSYKSPRHLFQKRRRWAIIEGRTTEKQIDWMLYSSAREFLESYVVDRGFQNGLYGLIASCSDSLYHLLVIYYLIRYNVSEKCLPR